MDNVTILWRSLFDRNPSELEHRLMSRLVQSGIDDSYICLCAIHVHFLVLSYKDAHIAAITRDMRKSVSQINDLLPVLTAGLDATITRAQGLEASARYTDQVLRTAARTMARIDEEHSFWRRLTTATPLPPERGWFLLAIFSMAAGGAIMANVGTILAILV